MVEQDKNHQSANEAESQIYFYPTQSIDPQILLAQATTEDETSEDWGTLGDDQEKEQKLAEKGKMRTKTLTDVANSVKSNLDAAQIKKWEISLEGYLEVSSGALPGGKAGFKATLKLINY